MKNLRSEVIKLANRKPHLRATLLPLLGKGISRKASGNLDEIYELADDGNYDSAGELARKNRLSVEYTQYLLDSGAEEKAYEFAISSDTKTMNVFLQFYAKKNDVPAEAVSDWVAYFGFDQMDSIGDLYQGQFDSKLDFGEKILDDHFGSGASIDELLNYFNRDSLIADLKADGWTDGKNSENGKFVEDVDGEVYKGAKTLEDLIDLWLEEGVIDRKMILQHFNTQTFANDLFSDYWMGDNGHVFLNV